MEWLTQDEAYCCMFDCIIPQHDWLNTIVRILVLLHDGLNSTSEWMAVERMYSVFHVALLADQRVVA